MANQGRAETTGTNVISTEGRARLVSEVFRCFPQDATDILVLLEPFLDWRLAVNELTQQAEDLAHHAISDLVGAQDKPMFLTVTEWQKRGLSNSQREIKRLQAVDDDYFERLDATTRGIRERMNPNHAPELFEWLARPFNPIIQSRDFVRFTGQAHRSLCALLGPLHGREIFEQFERLMLLPAMFCHADLLQEIRRFEARRKLLLAGNPLIGILHASPVVLVKS